MPTTGSRTAPGHRAVTDLLVVALASAGASVLLVAGLIGFGVPADAADQIVTLSGAAVGAAAAVLADIAARLTGHPRVAWSGAAFALYSLLVLPSTTLVADGPGAAAGLQTVRLVAYLAVIVLLLLAVQTSTPRTGAWGGWVIAVLAAALAVTAGELVTHLPDGLIRSGVTDALSVVALSGWAWVAVVYVVIGLRLHRAPLWRIGAGVTVLAAAQLYRIVSGTDIGVPNLAFAALRLTGLLMVAAAVAGFAGFAIRAVREDRGRHDEELRIAAVHMQLAAEASADRDHELRNGLAGLAGVAALLGDTSEGKGQTQLRQAVLAELGRLSRLVTHAAAPAYPSSTFDAAPILAELAALWRSRGMAVQLDTDAVLRLDGDGDLFRQILTNLLANCSRHAPGAAVRLTAHVDGPIAVIQVRDDGPGVPPGTEPTLFERGRADPTRGGTGVGLHLAREFATELGGTLEVLPRGAGTGFTIELAIPAGSGPDRTATPTGDGSFADPR